MPPSAIARSVAQHHVARVGVAGARVLAQQEQQLATAAETSARRRSRRCARSNASRNCCDRAARARRAPGTVGGPAPPARRRRSCVGQRLGRLARPCSRSACHTRAISLQDVDEPGPAPSRRRRKVGAAVERLQVRRQPDAHRPAAGPGRRLHERHVDAIDVGPLLAIDLDRHELLVQHRGDRRVLERLVLHHVAPVAGRVADRQKDRLVLGARLARTPRRPTDTSRRDCRACCSRYGLRSRARRFIRPIMTSRW